VEVLIRALTLKHALGWTYEETEDALRNNLMVRKFCRLYRHSVPDDTVLIRWDNVLQPSTLEALNSRVVEVARRVKVTRGRKLRTDTTVVETNIHYPTDSSLLADGVRILSRIARKVKKVVSPLGDAISIPKRLSRDRMRSVKVRIKGICTLSKAKTQAGKAQLKKTYQELIDIAQAGIRQATGLIDTLKGIPGCAYGQARGALQGLMTELEEVIPRLGQVIDQTVRRVILEQTVPSAEKIVSFFEPHTAIIHKDKPRNPTQFGRKVKLDEVDGGIISHYSIEQGNPKDSQLFPKSIDDHIACFGKPPNLVAADRGCWSEDNEAYARQQGIKKVVLPKSGKRSAQRLQHEHQPWFRKGMRFRAGIEGRISVVKHNQLLDRCLNHGEDGFYRWVGWGVMGANLTKIARTLAIP
jgi:IS5 family transposase